MMQAWADYLDQPGQNITPKVLSAAAEAQPSNELQTVDPGQLFSGL